MRLAHKRRFIARGRDFVLQQDGAPDRTVRLHAGEMHYFRVPEVHWEDRMLRLRAMGLNAVSTYVAWNWHEQVEGVFDYSSPGKNLTRFVQLADKLGFLVILRPGPYICAEWDFGGLPAWLLKYSLQENMTIRSSNSLYLSFVDRFWSDLLPRVQPLLIESGGPVALVQLENEFGHFGNASDASGSAYFDRLVEIARKHLGPDVLLITTDNGRNNFRRLGSRPGILAATNMGPWSMAKQADAELASTARVNGVKPSLVMELWTGWFQSWERSGFNEQHFNQSGPLLLAYVQELLELNASFTLYMAHGGTNFGFWNSATALNRKKGSTASFITTTYDYAAPISEEGHHGKGGDGVDKYFGLRKLLAKYRQPWEPPLPDEPAPPVLASYPGDGADGAVLFQRRAALRDPAVLGALCKGGWQNETTGKPTPMEVHGQQAGLIFYRYRKPAAGAGGYLMSGLLRSASDSDLPLSVTRFLLDLQVTLDAGGLNATSLRGALQQSSKEVEGDEHPVRHNALQLRARDRVTIWAGEQLVQAAKLNTGLHRGRGGPNHLEVELPQGALQNVTSPSGVLDILVEHLGRRCYVNGPGAFSREAYEDWKGMREAKLGKEELLGGWQSCGLPLSDLYAFNGSAPRASARSGEAASGPTFFEGSFQVSGDPADTFLMLNERWNTGTAFVNGFNLGRFARGARGPFDLYVPKSALRSGRNTVVVLDMNPGANLTLDTASVLFSSTRGPMINPKFAGVNNIPGNA